MISHVILWRLNQEERRLGVSLDYLRHILKTSFRSFLVFTKIMPISNHRRSLPVAPYFVARLVATQDADCGTCVQIEVNLARDAGVDPDVIRAVIERRVDDLPPQLADVYRFTESTVGATPESGAMRDAVRDHYGERGLVEMAMAIGACRFFPVVKRGLGYARCCSDVDITV